MGTRLRLHLECFIRKKGGIITHISCLVCIFVNERERHSLLGIKYCPIQTRPVNPTPLPLFISRLLVLGILTYCRVPFCLILCVLFYDYWHMLYMIRGTALMNIYFHFWKKNDVYKFKFDLHNKKSFLYFLL